MTKNGLSSMDLLPERWIRTPFSYSKIGANLSLLQQDTLLRVSGELQTYIKAFYNSHGHLSDKRPNGLFDANEMAMSLPPIEINVSDLGVDPSNYKKVKEAIDDLWHLEVRFHDAKERVYNDYHVFAQVQRPATEKGYTFFSKDGDVHNSEKMTGKIRFYINPIMAKYVFDMSQGYINHLRYIAKDSKKRSTPRVYLMLMHHCNFGRMNIEIPFTEVKDYLGMYEYDAQGNVVSEQYAEYARFKRNVLEVSRLDMERLAAEKKSDITFTYEPVYKGSQKRGNPDAIKFSIRYSELGAAHECMLHSDMMRKKLVEYIVRHVAGMERKRIAEILGMAPESKLRDVSRKIYESIKSLQEKKVADVRTYYLGVLQKIIASSVDGTAKQPQQLSLSFSQQKPLDPIKQWALSQQQMCRAVGDEVSRRTFAQMRYDGYEDSTKKLRVCCPMAVYEEVEASHVDLMQKVLTRNFGAGVQLSYRIMQEQGKQ